MIQPPATPPAAHPGHVLWVPLVAAVLGLAILSGLGIAAPPYLAILLLIVGYGALGLLGPAAWRPAFLHHAVPVWVAALLLAWLCALYVLPDHNATPMVLLACVLHLTTLCVLFFMRWPADDAARRASVSSLIFVLSVLPHSLRTLGGYGAFDGPALPLTLLIAHGALIGVLRSFSRSQAYVEQERVRSRLLFELAHRDALTDLHNRRALQDDLAAAGVGGQRLAIIDIDGLKGVNDTLGHVAGDDLLRRFALGLSRQVAGHGRAYRLSGDEFALLAQAEAAEVEAWVRAVVQEVQSVYAVAEASVGSVCREPGEGDSAWLSRADGAMYHSKRRRRVGLGARANDRP